MTDKIFTSDERKAVKARAQELGFKSVRDYMRSLVNSDAKQRGKPAPLEDDELDDPAESFRRAWGEVMRGEGVTLEIFRRRMAEDDQPSYFTSTGPTLRSCSAERYGARFWAN